MERGYWLLFSLTGIVFFCTIELSRPGGRMLAAWTGLLVAGVLCVSYCDLLPPRQQHNARHDAKQATGLGQTQVFAQQRQTQQRREQHRAAHNDGRTHR